MIDAIATRSHGVVTRRELMVAGISVKEIRHRLTRGALIRLYPGVYRVGHRAPSLEASYMAAVRAGGEGALLAGRAAARLYGLIAPRVHVAPEVVAPLERRLRGVRVRRSRVPLEPDAAVFRSIPITSVPRTVVDLAACLPLTALARAFHEAEVRFGLDPAAVEEVLERRRNAKGARNVRRIASGDAPVLLSRLESRFRELLTEHRLPLPETNRRVGKRYVDCRWKSPPLTVELDSYRFHHSRHAWEQDRRRAREARARGDEFRRYTYGDVFEETHYMLTELRTILGGGPPRALTQDRPGGRRPPRRARSRSRP